MEFCKLIIRSAVHCLEPENLQALKCWDQIAHSSFILKWVLSVLLVVKPCWKIMGSSKIISKHTTILLKFWSGFGNYVQSSLLPFYSNFDLVADSTVSYLMIFVQGRGYHISVEGGQVSNAPWNNISSQGFQVCTKFISHHVKSKFPCQIMIILVIMEAY